MLVAEPHPNDTTAPHLELEFGEMEIGKPIGCMVADKKGCVRITVKPHFI